MISSCLLVSTTYAELQPVSDDVLNKVSGQSGITLNAKVILGDESSIVFTNTSGKKKAEATSVETGYLIVDELQGAIEFEGLGFDLVSDLKNSGKSALQWTLPKKITATNFKTTGIYISSTEDVGPATSTFLMGLEMNGELSLPANTQISLFVVD
tara:strand:+ start:19128 stop:19592 length:465 start_codon:yes stop_codon:yes gene_type:complete